MRNENILGSLGVGRNVTVSNDGIVRGDLKVGHNLRVEGWLEAKNLRGAGKGLFNSEDSLKAAYPTPQAGWYALVFSEPSSLRQQLREGEGATQDGEGAMQKEAPVATQEVEPVAEVWVAESADGATCDKPATQKCGCCREEEDVYEWVATGKKVSLIEVPLAELEQADAEMRDDIAGLKVESELMSGAVEELKNRTTGLENSVAVLQEVAEKHRTIEISEIDTMGCESPTGIKGIVAGGNQVCYAVSHQGNNSGLLIMYGAGDCVAMQVLVSNYSGVGNDLFTAHRDDKLSVHYRYMPLNTVGAQNTGTGRYTWSEWKEWLSEEWMNGRVDELRSEVTTLKVEMAELKKMLEQSDANFAVMDIEWLEDAENGVWSKTLPARIEAEMQFRIGVNVNAAHVADSVSDWEVKRLANDPVADSAWNKRHPLTAAADGYVYIKISPDDILDASGTTFVFTANYTRTRNGVTYSQSVEGRLCMEMGGLVFYIDRGPWGIGEKYYCNTLNPEGRHETSDVWRYGCKWRCTATHTSSEQNGPGFAIPFWEFIEGDDRFFVEFAEPYTTVDLSNIEIPLTIRAWYHGEEVTAWIKDEDVVWSRYSESDENVPRTEQDAVWNAQNGNRGKAIVLTEPDFESRGSEGLGRISFTAVVTLRHPITGKAAMASKAYSA